MVKPQKVKPSEKAQIEKLWKEAERKGPTMRQPLGFNGSALWAIVFILIVGVVWIENRFGSNVAGAAILGVFGVLVFLAGQLTSIAGRQADGNLRVAEKQADAAVEKERIKGDNIVAKFEAQQQMKMFVAMLSLVMKMAKQAQKQPASTEDNAIELQEDNDVWI